MVKRGTRERTRRTRWATRKTCWASMMMKLTMIRMYCTNWPMLSSSPDNDDYYCYYLCERRVDGVVAAFVVDVDLRFDVVWFGSSGCPLPTRRSVESVVSSAVSGDRIARISSRTRHICTACLRSVCEDVLLIRPINFYQKKIQYITLCPTFNF